MHRAKGSEFPGREGGADQYLKDSQGTVISEPRVQNFQRTSLRGVHILSFHACAHDGSTDMAGAVELYLKST